MGVRPKIGFHAPIAGGLANALLKAHALGCDAVQIFSRNPRGWQARPLGAEEVFNFQRLREACAISPVVIHANYLINLAAADVSCAICANLGGFTSFPGPVLP